MGSVFRQRINRPIPPSATITNQGGKRWIRWKTRAGKWATAEVVTRLNGREMMMVESGTFSAKYRDADRVVRVVATGCRTEDAARQSLTRLERDTERVKVGVATLAELMTAGAAASPIKPTIDAYVATLTGSRMHHLNSLGYLTRLADGLNWHRPVDMKREDLERWLADPTRQGRSARSRNAYQTTVNAFANWCVRSSRLTSNPFGGLSKANTDANRRRQRRALTPDELQGLMLAPDRRRTQRVTTPRREPAAPL